MPASCVIGLQWGDEAKGKIVDLLTREHDFVVRYQGGANAGHTVVVGDQVYKLSLLPSGILTPGVTTVIATGVVVNPARVIEELDELDNGKPRALLSVEFLEGSEVGTELEEREAASQRVVHERDRAIGRVHGSDQSNV